VKVRRKAWQKNSISGLRIFLFSGVKILLFDVTCSSSISCGFAACSNEVGPGYGFVICPASSIQTRS